MKRLAGAHLRSRGLDVLRPHQVQGAELIVAGKQATAALNDCIRDQLELRRCPSHDGAGLITTMVRADYACDHMTKQEIVASNTQLVFARSETTAKSLAHLLVTLAAHPEQRRAIQADRALIPAAG